MGEASHNVSRNDKRKDSDAAAHRDAASMSAGIDLSQFYQVFFEEAGENLDTMEQMLLTLDIHNAGDEALNAIFRCAHSVKGGAATFGFGDVAELTHQMETLLDKLRRRELTPTAPMLDVLLASGDALKAQLRRHQGGGTTAAAPVDTSALLAAMRELAQGPAPVTAQSTPAKGSATAAPAQPMAPHAPAAATEPALRALALTVGPLPDPAAADSLVELFSEITGLGTIEALDAGRGADADENTDGNPDGLRRFKVHTTSSDNDLYDLFSFHVARHHVHLAPLIEGQRSPADATPALKPAAAARAEKAAAAPESSTLRVSVDKVDQLINLVGELVITQAMLAQNSKDAGKSLDPQWASGLADLERNTRDLQEAVMGIRMMPMSLVFNRFPRMLRDLAAKLDKKVDLVRFGEATELDKGLVEKITDPLTHLVRNSCDHGIESPAERLAQGKPEHGTITLIATHQGGSIAIEVRDDGRGLNRHKLLAKARERGLDVSDAMSDSDVHGLIFAPGFSTNDVVTDVSGRGVGMDVVKQNITALGGTVEIDSTEGCGMAVRVRLPLTLAIMDGMSVGVGDECYILPLSSVVESFQVREGMLKTIGGSGRVVEVRDEYMPVVDLEKVFNVPRFDRENVSSIMVVVEAEGSRVALRVDALLGQQQVVVKNLESNYRRVDDVSGATIMGDGRVALILDVASLIRRSRH